MATDSTEIPRGNIEGFVKHWKEDLLSGFFVFLIALPLCLGISVACGYPPIAGIFTAIIGSILTTFISNSELTIKGPAAGLIVIAIGCINDFGGPGSTSAYQAALTVGVAAAVMQILFGFFRAGILGEFFPLSAVHGMLAAIGVIIIIKQIPIAVGVGNSGEPLELLTEIPHKILEANPAIAAIGGVSILIMFLWPWITKRISVLKVIPAPIVVLLVAVPMGMGFDLLHKHSYVLQGHKYQLDDHYLVDMPDKVFGMFDRITFPDFSALQALKAWKWALMFFIIGSLESLLSAKAIDLIDPWKRKTSLDRDMVGVGAGNLCAAMLGGLPMISEIVRSKANIDNGARTRFADLWHGVFLLLCVALIPMILHRIPLAALAAMLIYTGYRLAHPTEFLNVLKIGREQLIIFVTTLVAVLATDLLIGIGIGIGVKIVIHIANGVPIRSLFWPYLEVVEEDESTVRIIAHQSAVFSNWIPFRRQIENLGLIQRKNVIIDLSDTKLVDHSVMDKLHELERDFEQENLELTIIGLETHQPLAPHAHAARRRGLAHVRRLTVVVEEEIASRLESEVVRLGATGYTSIPCTGAGRSDLGDHEASKPHVRIEVVVPKDICEAILDLLRSEIIPRHNITACVETVDVLRIEHFTTTIEESAAH